MFRKLSVIFIFFLTIKKSTEKYFLHGPQSTNYLFFNFLSKNVLEIEDYRSFIAIKTMTDKQFNGKHIVVK